MEKTDYTQNAQILKAMAHPTRLHILSLIRDKKHPCVRVMEESLGLAQPNISQHLTIMRHMGIVEAERDGNQMCYRIKDQKIEKLLKEILEF